MLAFIRMLLLVCIGLLAGCSSYGSYVMHTIDNENVVCIGSLVDGKVVCDNGRTYEPERYIFERIR